MRERSVRISVAAVILHMAFAGPALADVEFESKMMGMKIKTWTSGFKQRMEADVWSGGQPLTVITRADRKVQWTLDLEQKLYQEKRLTSEPASSGKKDVGWQHEDKPCAGTVTRLQGNDQIAGYPVIGYEVVCQGDEGQRMTLWLASTAGDMHTVEQETLRFEEAVHAIQYADSSPERDSFQPLGLSAISTLFGAIFARTLQQGSVLPKGIPMAIESVDPSAGAEALPVRIYEVTKVNVGTVDSDVFRVPGGFRKVDELPDARLRGLMQELEEGDISEEVRGILETQ